jgi:hypothetical protein
MHISCTRLPELLLSKWKDSRNSSLPCACIGHNYYLTVSKRHWCTRTAAYWVYVMVTATAVPTHCSSSTSISETCFVPAIVVSTVGAMVTLLVRESNDGAMMQKSAPNTPVPWHPGTSSRSLRWKQTRPSAHCQRGEITKSKDRV